MDRLVQNAMLGFAVAIGMQITCEKAFFGMVRPWELRAGVMKAVLYTSAGEIESGAIAGQSGFGS